MSDSELPPPPYLEQEFDQKVSEALLISTQQHQPSTQSEGEWEEWSDAAFVAAEARIKIGHSSQDAGSSALPLTESHERHGYYAASPQATGTVAPLKIHKRGKSRGASASSKPRPSWMDEDELDGSYSRLGSSSSSRHPADPHPPPNLHPWNTTQAHHDIPPDNEDEDYSVPPPPFTAMGPPMDGVIRMEYHPESTPPSPLASPVPSHHLPLRPDHLPQVHVESYSQQPNNGYPGEYSRGHTSPRQSLPARPRPDNYRLEQRPISTLTLHQSDTSPRMEFNSSVTPPRSSDHLRQRAVSTFPPSPLRNSSRVDFTPSVAYNKSGHQSFAPDQTPRLFNANAFYNAAVSAHLSIPTSIQPRESHSSHQHRPPERTYPQATAQLNALRLADQTSSRMSSISTGPSGAMNWSTSMVQGSYPAQHSTNASHFPQHPSYPTTYSGPTPHRWATSEQQINQNFQ